MVIRPLGIVPDCLLYWMNGRERGGRNEKRGDARFGLCRPWRSGMSLGDLVKAQPKSVPRPFLLTTPRHVSPLHFPPKRAPRAADESGESMSVGHNAEAVCQCNPFFAKSPSLPSSPQK